MTFNGENIREDFPLLSRKVYSKELIYLDSAATSQKPVQVLEAMDRAYRCFNANVHRGVHFLSEEMTEMYENSRKQVASYIGAASKEEIIFSSGATASLNMVARSWCEKTLRKGDNVVVSRMEHHSNIVPWQIECLRYGAELRVLEIDRNGEILYDMLDSVVDQRTRVVAITEQSNTLSTEPDLRRIIAKAHQMGAVVVVDGCQGVVHLPVDVVAEDYDFYAFSAHKLYGPLGLGVLYGKKALLEDMPVCFSGGEMVDHVSFEKTTFAPLPLRFEAGTPNFIGAYALASALDYLSKFDKESIASYECSLTDYLISTLEREDGVTIYGKSKSRGPIVSFNVEGCDHYDLGVILDKMGVAIRTGHHCAEPVMDFFGVHGMCRASLAMYSTKNDIDAFGVALHRAISMLRR
ncbi:MAG: SufS family cysteine desulfurase [Alistipes sp.]|nr:SufS family cysteine desulfurase [Candidatus Alistipes equi]